MSSFKTKICQRCNGTGKYINNLFSFLIPNNSCLRCNGSGTVKVPLNKKGQEIKLCIDCKYYYSMSLIGEYYCENPILHGFSIRNGNSRFENIYTTRGKKGKCGPLAKYWETK